MLHILWLILKIIGIIVAVILGVIVLLLCIILFVPLKYQVEGTYKNALDSLEVEMKVSWLWHLMVGKVSFENMQMKWFGRILWMKFPREEKKKKETKKKETIVPDTKSTIEYDQVSKATIANETSTLQSIPSETITSKTMETGRTMPLDDEKKKQKDRSKKIKFTEYIRIKLQSIKEKIRNIKCTIIKIYDNIKRLLKKKEDLVDFINNEIHKNAFLNIRDEVLKFLKYLKPKKFKIYATIGFEDPCTTGQMLATLSIVYPFIGDNATIIPDFEKQILEGQVFVKGKIRGIFVVIVGIRLLLKKELRRTIRDIRKYEL